MRLLSETSSFGMDVIPSVRNVEFYWKNLLSPSIESGSGSILVAEYDGYVVGGLFWPVIATELDLTERYATGLGVYVSPEYRGQGIATELRQTALAQLAIQGVDYVIGFVHSTNESGISSASKINNSFVGSVIKFPTHV